MEQCGIFRKSCSASCANDSQKFARDTENENEAQKNLEENRTESRRKQTEEKEP